jgi:hypothetical protein
MATESELPCLDLLEATPAILRGLMTGLSHDDVRWKPAPDRFSIAEVLAHLSHSEGHGYRMRVDRLMEEERPEFEPDDAHLHLELYRRADPEDSFDHFEDQREANVEYLRALPASAGKRVALHTEAGEITLEQMLQEWAMHDLGPSSPFVKGTPASGFPSAVRMATPTSRTSSPKAQDRRHRDMDFARMHLEALET